MVFNVKKIIIVLAFISCFLSSYASDDYLIKDLNESWLVYNPSLNSYVPLTNLTQKRHTFNIQINTKNYERFLFRVKTSNASEIYINQQFFFETQTQQDTLIPIKEIRDFSGKDSVLISVYSQNIGLKPTYAAIIRKGNTEIGLSAFGYKLSPKKSELYKNLLLISLLSILVLIAILKSIDSEKLEIYFNLVRLFSNRKVDDYLYQNAFSATTLPYLISSSFIISVVLLINRYSFFPLDTLGIDNGFLKLTGVVLLNALIILALYLVKYLYLRFIGVFVSVRRFSERHFFEFSRVFSIGFAIILLFSLAINSFNLSASWLNITLFLFFLLWIIRIAFVGRQELGFKNMYLFSYLCASEIIPFILILKNIGTF